MPKQGSIGRDLLTIICWQVQCNCFWRIATDSRHHPLD